MVGFKFSLNSNSFGCSLEKKRNNPIQPNPTKQPSWPNPLPRGPSSLPLLPAAQTPPFSFPSHRPSSLFLGPPFSLTAQPAARPSFPLLSHALACIPPLRASARVTVRSPQHTRTPRSLTTWSHPTELSPSSAAIFAGPPLLSGPPPLRASPPAAGPATPCALAFRKPRQLSRTLLLEAKPGIRSALLYPASAAKSSCRNSRGSHAEDPPPSPS